jgi:hypothetical protein
VRVGVKKRHGRTDVAQEQTWHERADVARRDNEAGVSKGKTIKKKNLHKPWTNRCSDQGINTAGRGQEGG